jgi:hypothetical protein
VAIRLSMASRKRKKERIPPGPSITFGTWNLSSDREGLRCRPEDVRFWGNLDLLQAELARLTAELDGPDSSEPAEDNE